MDCPACGNKLTEIEAGGITVDACVGGCGGIWFDQLELRKFDEPHEGAGEALLEIERDPDVEVDHSQRFNCPKCEGIVMARHFFSAKREAEVDECPNCAGVWLDPGELAAIRSQFGTDEEREEAAGEYFDELFGDEMEAMKAESEEKLRKARKFARMFKYICPSYWIPGDQEWGAF